MTTSYSSDRRSTFDLLVERVILFAAFLHLAFFLLFVRMDAVPLAAVNVASICAYLVSFILIKRGHRYRGILIVVSEVVIHAVIATFAIGWSSGFHYYLILLAPFTAFGTMLAMRVKITLALLATASYIAFDVLLRGRPAALSLPDGVIETFYYFNVFGVLLMLSFISLFYCHLIELKEAALVTAANTDPLTQLPNRRCFMQAVNRELFRPGNEGADFYFIICDLDHFKSINDRYGHETGDAVLRSIGLLLVDEIHDHSKLCRWGGEEFLVMLTRMEQPQVLLIAERLRRKVEDLDFVHEGTNLRLSMTLGVTSLLRLENVEHAIARADLGLYKGKDLGRNRVVLI